MCARIMQQSALTDADLKDPVAPLEISLPSSSATLAWLCGNSRPNVSAVTSRLEWPITSSYGRFVSHMPPIEVLNSVIGLTGTSKSFSPSELRNAPTQRSSRRGVVASVLPSPAAQND